MKFSFNGLKRPILVAGPCAAESASQLLRTAEALKRSGKVSLFRCGSWKVRSKPEGFEGIGEASFPVLQRIEKEMALPVSVEVASPAQVETLLRYGISCCWIGARTTVNPHQVAEIAEAARDSGLSVLVKNPVAADLKLWEGAFERLLKAGLTDLAAVHRGFAVADASPYRNRPFWHLAIEWKRRHPEWPLICDPSHIAGCRSLIPEVAQKALNLNYDGLMLEVHPEPDAALSDAAQQLTPQQFEKLLSGLRVPVVPTADGRLSSYRAVLDEIDSELLSLLSRRMEVSRQIARVKMEEGLPLLQMERWREVLSAAVRQAGMLGLEPSFVEEWMQLVHSASLEVQEKVLGNQDSLTAGEQKSR